MQRHVSAKNQKATSKKNKKFNVKKQGDTVDAENKEKGTGNLPSKTQNTLRFLNLFPLLVFMLPILSVSSFSFWGSILSTSSKPSVKPANLLQIYDMLMCKPKNKHHKLSEITSR